MFNALISEAIETKDGSYRFFGEFGTLAKIMNLGGSIVFIIQSTDAGDIPVDKDSNSPFE